VLRTGRHIGNARAGGAASHPAVWILAEVAKGEPSLTVLRTDKDECELELRDDRPVFIESRDLFDYAAARFVQLRVGQPERIATRNRPHAIKGNDINRRLSSEAHDGQE
jgi:hypothetical protein